MEPATQKMSGFVDQPNIQGYFPNTKYRRHTNPNDGYDQNEIKPR